MFTTESALECRLTALHTRFFSDLACKPSADAIRETEHELATIAMELNRQRDGRTLSSSVIELAYIVASNIAACALSWESLEKESQRSLLELSERLDSVVLSGTSQEPKSEGSTRRRLLATKSYPTPPPELPLTPAPSTPQPPSPPLLELQPADHLRLWFLDHLANPYPTITEKKELSLVTGIAKNKIDSDMTNWRRRAGWTDIKDTYADRDKMKMKRLIEAVESGKEKRKVVIEAVEKMRAYLERREEYGVGSWVWSLKKMAKEEQARKRPRIEGKGKGKADRPITPPPSAHVTPASSASSVGSSTGTVLGVDNTSPAISLRSTTSASSLGSTTSLPTFTNFKPYSFTPAPLTYTSASRPAPAPTTSAPPAASLAPGTKRANADAVVDAPNTRQKLAPSPFSAEGVPQWASADPFPVQSQPEQRSYAPAYVSSASLYPAPPAAHFAEPILWCATGPMPPHLPHMSTMPRTMPSFSIPQQHNFEFTTP